MQAETKTELLEGYEWPTPEQMHVLGELAAEHPSVKIERVRGSNDARLTWEKTPYLNGVKIVDEFGADVTGGALRPETATIDVPVDVLVKLIGSAHVESAIRTAIEQSPTFPAHRLGVELRDEFLRAIERAS
jgi:hypothetical protein